ncbi:ABC transporter permease [Streptomyces sp. NPDC049687]|uniref:ABC transporter permease n=1 Tax=Streptomyces sp. NPDC049687 TaxID=3365596 RepID=UPI0037B73ECE
MSKRLLAGWKVRLGLAVFAFFCVLALAGPWVTDHLLHQSPTALDLNAVSSPPSAKHLLGTTASGHDVLAQVITGARESMIAGLVASVLGTFIAVVIGVTAGLAGGIVDSALTGLTNVFLTMPSFALIFVISGYTQGSGPVAVGVIIGAFGWAGGTRALRSQTLSLRSRDFVHAMRMLGESRWRLAMVEVLPHLTGWISAMFLTGFIGGVLAESGLAFLGVSSASTVSWGVMISEAQQGNALIGGMWWWFAPPGLCIALLGASVALINFAVDEISDPRLRDANRLLVKRAGDARRAKEREQEEERGQERDQDAGRAQEVSHA